MSRGPRIAVSVRHANGAYAISGPTWLTESEARDVARQLPGAAESFDNAMTLAMNAVTELHAAAWERRHESLTAQAYADGIAAARDAIARAAQEEVAARRLRS